MDNCVEFVTFRVQDGRRAEFLAARGPAIQAVQSSHPELIGAPVLAEHEDGSWTDVWIYRTAAAAERAGRESEKLPAFMAMAELLTDVRIQVASMPEESRGSTLG